MKTRFLHFLPLLLLGLSSHFVFSQATNITVSGCPDNTYDGVYTLSASMCSGCQVYEKNGGGAFLYRANAPTNFLFGGNTSLTCAAQPMIISNTENDCIATNNTVINTCVLVDGILPIELVGFTARKMESSVQISWQTLMEESNDYMAVERSGNGIDFKEIGRIKGVGTTTDLQSYEFEDPSPHFGQNYYRLKQVDYDGYFEHSNVINIRFESEENKIGIFYPNPTSDGTVNLDYNSVREEELNIFVFDMTGKVVQNLIRQIDNGYNHLIFDFSTLEDGMYIVKWGTSENTVSRKLIIK